MLTDEAKAQRTVVTLYRCGCKHCAGTEEELKRLAEKYGASFEIKQVEKEGLGNLAGWRTPIVYVNGAHITHYETSPRKWEEAIKKGVASVPTMVIGEVVDINCYMEKEARGEQHKRCAEACIQAGVPMGLAASDGQVYLLVEDKEAKGAYETLKKMAAERVRITGDMHRRGGVQSIVVKAAERVP